ncbi:putative lipid II flippase FtsW [Pseudoclavibacter chungangensis]|uniref:Probable peptidoglycan glycosyltransferase FtsW n=1 Tax=Pseudoclavibacter chungangensis TaxID=587635 RepID=A0A7J5BZM2_9MICO|nr:putative lipid II flippase FtsW [Pseudoclavibacter chungangensis]KAB1660107.1 putative lipid II flippase FtsW [Pseudoclavibacter chungangensis]NYJ66788.1 cell division protein FtsW [Pseudoclavibacter chungangensis]
MTRTTSTAPRTGRATPDASRRPTGAGSAERTGGRTGDGARRALDGARAVTVSLGERVQAGDRNVYLLLGITLFLVVYGLVMVLSSSAVEEFAAGNAVSDKFVRQAVFAVAGIPLMLIASRMPLRFWSALAWPMLIGATVLQALVLTPLGIEEKGNRAWLDIGGLTFQPAELLKVALVVWLGFIVSRKREKLTDWRHVAIPILPVLAVSIGIALAGGDLGTVIIIGGLVLGALYFGGVPMRFLLIAVTAAAAGAIAMVLVSGNRMSRITCFINDTCPYETWGWQSAHGRYALAAGGLFGVGLGNSSAKWSWLPEADNDFIFAIVGEELGLVGALVMILLFVALALVMVRIIVSTDDPFRRTTIGGVAVWLVFQAFVNMAVVLDLLPVLGVPLPLVSSGGSALITTLLAIGIVVSMANEHERPERRRTA